MMRKLDASQWSEYWRKGTITTFHKQFEDNYDGEIREFWFDILAGLKAGTRVVDLATGNGALIQLLLDFSQQEQLPLSIDGVDFADIKPRLKENPLATVCIHANTEIEKTGLLADSFDLIISQYGLEYADLPPALAEIRRLAKMGAKLALIVHTEGSQLIRQGKETLVQIDFVARQANIPPIVKALLERLAVLRRRGQSRFEQDPRAEKQRAKLNRKLQAIIDFSDTQEDPGFLSYLIDNCMGVFQSAAAREMTTGQKLAVLNGVEAETRAYRKRMEDLITAALSTERLAALKTLIFEAGFEIEMDKDLFYKGSLFGRQMVAQRVS